MRHFKISWQAIWVNCKSMILARDFNFSRSNPSQDDLHCDGRFIYGISTHRHHQLMPNAMLKIGISAKINLAI